MFILLPVSLLLLTTLALLALNWMRPDFRFFWLLATGSALLTWLIILLWYPRLPLTLRLPPWQPASLFAGSPAFLADAISWPYAISLATLILSTMLTAIARGAFPYPLPWAGVITLGALGLLAVLADNPLTLVLTWAALDLAELVTMLRSVESARLSERAVSAFAAKTMGLLLLLWANMVNVASGSPLAFHAMAPKAGIYLVLAAGLRLGVLPLHLPYTPESILRRGFGTALRLVSAASSMILLARIPVENLPASSFTPLLLALVTLAALYGGWQWVRAPNELSGRPYLIIASASLATIAVLGGNARGAVAWGIALLLAGGALFLHSFHQNWPARALLIGGAWGLSALPFSPTAAAWQDISLAWPFWPPIILSQGLLLAGYVRHARGAREPFPTSIPPGGQTVYPTGILLPIALHLGMGLWGWEGALTIGWWWIGLSACLIAAGITWLYPRIPILSPNRAHWVHPTNRTWTDALYRLPGSVYRLGTSLGDLVARTLEGDGGILWTLLLLTLFISILTQGAR